MNTKNDSNRELNTKEYNNKEPKVKPLRIDQLLTVDPATEKQRQTHQAWKKDNHNIVMSGSAGTGKTFTALYLALEQVLDKSNPLNKIHIIRSVVPSREMGFLPGTIEEKMEPYISPYIQICDELFDIKKSYNTLVAQGVIEFHSTSFIRGTTFNDCIIIVDEMQNMNGRELNTIVTRVGQNCRLIMCGDYHQSDFATKREKQDILLFLSIIEQLSKFSVIHYDWRDIIRSDFVREYIMTKELLKLDVDW